MKLTCRKYQGEDDYWRIREFLRRVLILNGYRQYSWHVARLDYWRWHVVLNCGAFPNIDDALYLWETTARELAAVVCPEGPGEAHFQVHPAYRSAAVEAELLEAAQTHLAQKDPQGAARLTVWCHATDHQRQALLERSGYKRGNHPEHSRRCDLEKPFPAAEIPAGYSVRSLGNADELPARSWLSWRAFHPDEPDEMYEGWEWYHNIQRIPIYRRDLDLVAVAQDGSLAAFCTVWYDDVTRSGYFEPVGTDPSHHRRGLGRAVLAEGLRRLRSLGGKTAFVGGYSTAANGLYNAAGFIDFDLIENWANRW